MGNNIYYLRGKIDYLGSKGGYLGDDRGYMGGESGYLSGKGGTCSYLGGKRYYRVVRDITWMVRKVVTWLSGGFDGFHDRFINGH